MSIRRQSGLRVFIGVLFKMNNIWSDNKLINLCINILIFLVGINFLHFGQLILPVICFLLFADNRLKFKVNDPKLFIGLCLFGLAFFAFTYKYNAFYSVMGFTCPMAYYIGSNMKHPSEENIKKIVYLFAISMSLHIILNSIYEYIVHGHHGFFMSTTHYDFWTKEKIANTATAVNIDILIGCLYYLIFHEKNNAVRISLFVLFAASLFYLLVIARRTPIFMAAIVMVFSFVYEAYILKNSTKKQRKIFTILACCAIATVALLVTIYSLNLFNCRVTWDGYHIVQKFKQKFINDQRFELYFGSFGLMPNYLWGGQHISTILGEQVHDFWIDIYDYAGIVPCFVMIVCSVMELMVIIRCLKSNRISNEFKTLILGVSICIIMQLFFEPVMTGASLFLLIAIIILGFFERIIVSKED